MDGLTIRVYGILVKDNKLLISDEVYAGKRFTKFPGGGLELGEGLIDCLHREFKEEMETTVQVKEHFYVNPNFVASAFAGSKQLISHYFLVDAEPNPAFISSYSFDFPDSDTKNQSFRWINLSALTNDTFTYAIDKEVGLLLRQKFLR